ncbi:MAG: PQQ-dependent sugar dehydrogenase [Patescibacteria group bacterium]|jgi:glucose/arabinose dehydrogenase
MMKKGVALLVLMTLFGGLWFYFRLPTKQEGNRPGNSIRSASPVPTKSVNPEVLAENLEIPWEIVFLPEGDMLVTERSGKLLRVGARTQVVQEIAGVAHIGEGGLLGMALHPNFKTNHYVYLYSTTRTAGGITNRVERYKFIKDTLTNRVVILEGIKGSANHDGGRIAFGPDGYLYITTGDAENPSSAQDTTSLNGKILRITDDGSIPKDNPFGNAVYSYGHRNPQGLVWDASRTLWETEHGPSGLETGYDELNIIKKGGNYGWPIIKGDQQKNEMIVPVIHSGSQDTWAPSGLTFVDGNLYFSGLRGESLYKATIGAGNKVSLSRYLQGTYGRLRAAVTGPDGYLYLTTSNRDGRALPRFGDDKIIRVNVEALK